MRAIGNLIWFVFGGFVMGVAWLIAGLLMLVSIVGIPWARSCFVLGSFSFALQHLKLAGCALAPVGKTVVSKELAAEARRRNAMARMDRIRG